MHKATHTTFEFSRQHLPEVLVSAALVAHLQAHAAPGVRFRLLPHQEQFKGDVEVNDAGGLRYIEIKIESYPATLFLEPFQMWGTREGFLEFRRSWAFTTTADTMLYIGPRHTHALWVPRRAWLTTGLELMEAAMLASVDGPQLFTPNLTLNSAAAGNGQRRFKGAAAGLAMGVDLWLRAFAEREQGPQELLMAELGDWMPSVMRAARQSAKSLEQLQALVGEHLDLSRVPDAAEVLSRWAVRAFPLPGEAGYRDNGADARRVRRTWQELTGRESLLSVTETLQAWLALPLKPQRNAPVDFATTFLAHACFESGWPNAGGFDNLEDLAKQAMAMPLVPRAGEENVWPRAAQYCTYLRTYGSKARHGAQPPTQVVLEHWRQRHDTAYRREQIGRYLAPSRLPSGSPAPRRWQEQAAAPGELLTA